MLERHRSKLLRKIDYGELWQSSLTAAITAPSLGLLEQSLRVNAPADSQLLAAGIYYSIAVGMTYRGIVHIGRAFRGI